MLVSIPIDFISLTSLLNSVLAFSSSQSGQTIRPARFGLSAFSFSSLSLLSAGVRFFFVVAALVGCLGILPLPLYVKRSLIEAPLLSKITVSQI
jgi:hypothetical protein